MTSGSFKRAGILYSLMFFVLFFPASYDALASLNTCLSNLHNLGMFTQIDIVLTFMTFRVQKSSLSNMCSDFAAKFKKSPCQAL